jgi:hypothetical protein
VVAGARRFAAKSRLSVPSPLALLPQWRGLRKYDLIGACLGTAATLQFDGKTTMAYTLIHKDFTPTGVRAKRAGSARPSEARSSI